MFAVKRRCARGSPGGGFRRPACGFTLLELTVSVSLMVLLLGVLAFVFKTSASAVGIATEAVTALQKIRNFDARLSRELAASVALVRERTTADIALMDYAAPLPAGQTELRAFCFLTDAGGTVKKLANRKDDAENAEQSAVGIEFVSQTLKDGIMDTWDVRYYFKEDFRKPGTGYIMRRARDVDLWEKAWESEEPPFNKETDAEKWAQRPEVLVGPVKGPAGGALLFQAAADWDTLVLEGGVQVQNPRLPAYLKVRATFLDSFGGDSFEMPMEFYFPVYQGN